MEIEIGDYVRTKDGYIAKAVGNIKCNWLYFDSAIMEIGECVCTTLNPLEQKERVVAHSKNIIDLLEEGDFVNGMMIEEFADYDEGIYLGVPIYTDALMDTIEEVRPLDSIEIKTILTKEQYMNNCYVVEE